MAATKSTIEHWIERGIAQKATHMIVVCDTFDWEDYPVFVSEKDDVHKVYKEHSEASMQKVMEVYDLRKDIQEQLT